MDEKAPYSPSYTERVKESQDGSENEVPTTTIDPFYENRIWRKMDLYLLPVITIFYLLSFLDRTNLGNARIAGLQGDLKMSNKQYSIALTVTFVPYIFAELPSNLLLRFIGAKKLLPTILILWGTVTTLQGVVKSYEGLLACRFFLGLLEGGSFPGLVYYCSLFYPRNLLQFRVTFFFSAVSLSGAFGGLLAYAIVQMHGVGGRPGWAWIFILEGLFSVVFGFFCYLVLPPQPEDARFLTPGEKEYVARRVREDEIGRKAETTFKPKEILRAFTQPSVLIQTPGFFCTGSMGFALAYFTPSIVKDLGYTATKAQLMSVPPFATAFLFAVISSTIADRYQCRGMVASVTSITPLVGFVMFLTCPTQPMVQYGSLFLMMAGTYTAGPAMTTWQANNTFPQTRRATAIAWALILTNSGGILSTWLFAAMSPPPRYTKATVTMIIFSVVILVGNVINYVYIKAANRRKARLRETTKREDEPEGLGNESAWYIYNI